MTLGLGEPKVSQSSVAFDPSVNVYIIMSSVMIWAGSSETTHTKRCETHTHTEVHTQKTVK